MAEAERRQRMTPGKRRSSWLTGLFNVWSERTTGCLSCVRFDLKHARQENAFIFYAKVLGKSVTAKPAESGAAGFLFLLRSGWREKKKTAQNSFQINKDDKNTNGLVFLSFNRRCCEAVE